MSINVKFEMFNWNNSFDLTPSISIGLKIQIRTSAAEKGSSPCYDYSKFLSLTFFFFHPPNDKSKFRQHYNLPTDNVGNL